MKYSDLISGIFWLVTGLLLSIWSTSYKIGSILNPGPSFLPLALGLLLVLFSLILLGQAKKSSHNKKKVPSSFLPGGWKKICYTVLILLLATFLFETIGYLLTVFFLIVFLMMSEAELKSWKKIFITALLTGLGIYIVFVLLLKQPLPRGFLGI